MPLCTVRCGVAQYHHSIVQHRQRLYNTAGAYFLPASIVAGDGRGEERGGESRE